MKKVVYISHDSSLTGAPRSLLNMISGLEHEIEPIVILPKNGDLERYLVNKKIRYIVVPFTLDFLSSSCNQDSRYILKDNYNAAIEIAQKIKGENIHLVHSNTSVENIGVFLAYILNVPHIWHVREFMEEDYDAHYIQKEIKIRLFNSSSQIISISNAIKNSLFEKYSVEAVCIHNGIALPAGEIVRDNSTYRNALITGLIQKGKGQIDAVRAVKLLRDKGIVIHLTIVGWGNNSYSWTLSEYIKTYGLENQITILDFVDDLSELRKNSGLSLTCSKFEALGRCTIEGMYAKQFVIGTNSAGTREIIGDKEDRGFLYQFNDPNDLAMQIEKYLSLTDYEKKRIIEDAYRYATSEYSVSSYSQKILDIYNLFNTHSSFEGHESLKKIILDYKLQEIDDCFSTVSSSINYTDLLGDDDLKDVISGCGFGVIGIYGMGNWGIKLYRTCQECNIYVAATFDKNIGYLQDIMPYYSIGDEIPSVDAIVVCVEKYEKQIIDSLKCIYSGRIVGLSDVINNFPKHCF